MCVVEFCSAQREVFDSDKVWTSSDYSPSGVGCVVGRGRGLCRRAWVVSLGVGVCVCRQAWVVSSGVDCVIGRGLWTGGWQNR